MDSKESVVSIRNTTRGPVPRVPFEAIARKVLGKDYSLSLVICGDTLSRRVNLEYRKKDYSPNVLSFPLTPTEGEIFINVLKAERESKGLGTTTTKRIAHLFTHGCFHLKGLDHSDEMDDAEDTVLHDFKLD